MTANRENDPAREAAKGHFQAVWNLLRFLPGGFARLFGPVMIWAMARPVLIGLVGTPSFGQITFLIFAASCYWTHLHSKRFK